MKEEREEKESTDGADVVFGAAILFIIFSVLATCAAVPFMAWRLAVGS